MDLKHHFLIATPQVDDEFFAKSVVYICEHSELGTMGIIINHPTDLSVAELWARINYMMADTRDYQDALVVAGGPMHMDRHFTIHSKSPVDFTYSYPLTDGLWLTSSVDVIGALGTASQPAHYLMALGCASWAPNQLEDEIRNHDWLVVPADHYVLFDAPYEQRYEAAKELLGIHTENFIYRVGNA